VSEPCVVVRAAKPRDYYALSRMMSGAPAMQSYASHLALAVLPYVNYAVGLIRIARRRDALAVLLEDDAGRVLAGFLVHGSGLISKLSFDHNAGLSSSTVIRQAERLLRPVLETPPFATRSLHLYTVLVPLRRYLVGKLGFAEGVSEWSLHRFLLGPIRLSWMSKRNPPSIARLGLGGVQSEPLYRLSRDAPPER